MGVIQPLYRQSNKDLSLQAYGSLDKLIKFCKENRVVDINVTNTTQYVFDENEIVNREFTGYKYATQYVIPTTPPENPNGYITQVGDNYITQLGDNYIPQS